MCCVWKNKVEIFFFDKTTPSLNQNTKQQYVPNDMYVYNNMRLKYNVHKQTHRFMRHLNVQNKIKIMVSWIWMENSLDMNEYHAHMCIWCIEVCGAVE